LGALAPRQADNELTDSEFNFAKYVVAALVRDTKQNDGEERAKCQLEVDKMIRYMFTAGEYMNTIRLTAERLKV
jgi:hypothetical protein